MASRFFSLGCCLLLRFRFVNIVKSSGGILVSWVATLPAGWFPAMLFFNLRRMSDYSAFYNLQQGMDPMAVKSDYFCRQSGVIPYRVRKGNLEILLITSRRERRWIIPKGIIEPDYSARNSAAKEA